MQMTVDITITSTHSEMIQKDFLENIEPIAICIQIRNLSYIEDVSIM